MNDREKLIALLKENTIPEYWAEMIAEHLIANGVTIQRWLPVAERLPEIDQPCLCYKRAHGEDGYRLGTYLGASFSEKCAAFKSMSHYGCIGATHWMPLPEPPKEVE